MRIPSLHQWRQQLGSERAAYVWVTVAVNLLFLVRSYVAMRVLDYAELGQLALLQSVMLLVATLQFGVINGGYRMMCGADEATSHRINNFAFSFLLLISAGVIAVMTVGIFASDDVSRAVGLTLALGSGAGVLVLLRNWISNMMTARIALAALNQSNLIAAAISLIALLAVPLAPLWACIASVILQPAAFVAITLLRNGKWRPDGVNFSPALLRQLLASGFILFLTGLLVQLNAQLERWYVVDQISLEALGHLYLAILFVTLYQLVPSTMDGLFLPRLVTAHNACDSLKLRQDLRRFLALLAYYTLGAVGALMLLAEPLLGALLPKYLEDLHYVYLIVPGLALMTLAGPFAIVGNVLIRYRTVLVAYGSSTMLMILVFGLALSREHHLGLDEVSMLRSAGYLLIGALLLVGFFVMCRDQPEFRFFGRSGLRRPSR